MDTAGFLAMVSSAIYYMVHEVDMEIQHNEGRVWGRRKTLYDTKTLRRIGKSI